MDLRRKDARQAGQPLSPFAPRKTRGDETCEAMPRGWVRIAPQRRMRSPRRAGRRPCRSGRVGRESHHLAIPDACLAARNWWDRRPTLRFYGCARRRRCSRAGHRRRLSPRGFAGIRVYPRGDAGIRDRLAGHSLSGDRRPDYTGFVRGRYGRGIARWGRRPRGGRGHGARRVGGGALLLWWGDGYGGRVGPGVAQVYGRPRRVGRRARGVQAVVRDSDGKIIALETPYGIVRLLRDGEAAPERRLSLRESGADGVSPFTPRADGAPPGNVDQDQSGPGDNERRTHQPPESQP